MHLVQKKLLDLIGQKEIGHLSLREIGTLIGETHPQKVRHHLEQLLKKGLVTYNKSKNSYSLVRIGDREESNFISIPIVGSANCGQATMISDSNNIEGFLKVSKSMVNYKDSLIALKAIGNSMNKANINGCIIEEGDYVIIDCKYRTANDGDYVLSIIDNLANIKRFFIDQEHKQVILISESTQDTPPIYIAEADLDSYFINGKVERVIKKPRFI